MSTPQRLPIVNSDDGTWGDIIRQYLKKEHYDDGTDNAVNGGHQNVTIRPGTATAGTAPLKFSSGTLLTTPEAGAVEFNTDTLYFTITSGTTRKKIAMYDDSSGATGDLYYRNASGALTRLPAGTTNQFLGMTSPAAPIWRPLTYLPVTFKSTSYTISGTDTVILADASGSSVTITLPSASSVPSYRFYIKRIDASATNTVTVACNGADTIDGVSSLTLDQQYTAFSVVAGGATSWYIL